MRFILSLTIVSVMAIFIACQASASSPTEGSRTAKVDNGSRTPSAEPLNMADDRHSDEDDAKRISLEDAKKEYDSGNAVFIDTRSKNAFANEHIKGAVNIPLGEFETRYKELPKNKKLIVYCS